MNSIAKHQFPVLIPLISLISLITLISLISCAGQKKESTTPIVNTPSTAQQPANTMRVLAGGACKECKLMFLGMPMQLHAIDTSAGWTEGGQKLVIEGTVFQQDGITPAPDVIVYYYHTDPKGNYTPTEGMLPSARQHGHLRGWIKTGPDGHYAIFTSRPGQYPNENIEAHIHVYVKEPYLDVPYRIDEWIFDDDPLVTKAMRSKLQNMGGNPILVVEQKNDVQRTKHDIILGQNIPGYPK